MRLVSTSFGKAMDVIKRVFSQLCSLAGALEIMRRAQGAPRHILCYR